MDFPGRSLGSCDVKCPRCHCYRREDFSGRLGYGLGGLKDKSRTGSTRGTEDSAQVQCMRRDMMALFQAFDVSSVPSLISKLNMLRSRVDALSESRSDRDARPWKEQYTVDEVRRLRVELDMRKMELESHSKSVDSYKAEVASLRRANDRLMGELADASGIRSNMDHTNRVLRAEVDGLQNCERLKVQATVEQLQQRIGEYKRVNSDLRRQHDSAMLELRQRGRDYNIVSEELRTKTIALHKKEAELCGLRNRCDDLERDVSVQKAKYNAVNVEISKTVSQLEEFEKPRKSMIVADIDSDPTYLKQQVMTLRTRVENLSNRLSVSQSETRILQSRIERSEFVSQNDSMDVDIEKERRKTLALLLAKVVHMFDDKMAQMNKAVTLAMNGVAERLEAMMSSVVDLQGQTSVLFALRQCQLIVDAVWSSFGDGEAPVLRRFARFPNELSRVMNSVVHMQKLGAQRAQKPEQQMNTTELFVSDL